MKSFSSNGSKTDVDIVSNKLHKLIASSVLGLTDVTTRCGWFKLRERLFWAAMDVTQTLVCQLFYHLRPTSQLNTFMCVVSKQQYCKVSLPRKISCNNLQFFLYSSTCQWSGGGGAFSTLDGRMVHSLSLMTRCTVNILTFMLEN